MSFKISDKQLLKKYDQIWKRIEKVLKIKFDSKQRFCYLSKEKVLSSNTCGRM